MISPANRLLLLSGSNRENKEQHENISKEHRRNIHIPAVLFAYIFILGASASRATESCGGCSEL